MRKETGEKGKPTSGPASSTSKIPLADDAGVLGFLVTFSRINKQNNNKEKSPHARTVSLSPAPKDKLEVHKSRGHWRERTNLRCDERR